MQEAPTGSTRYPLPPALRVRLTAALLLARPGAAPAQTSVGSAHHPACDAPAFQTFDFRPGEWRVECRLRTKEGWHETTRSAAGHWVITRFSTRAPGRIGRWTGDFDEAGEGES
jgi:hypothetical protein